MRARRLAPVALVAALLLAHPAKAAQLLEPALPGPGAPAGHGEFAAPVEAENALPQVAVTRGLAPLYEHPTIVDRTQLYPSYTWPMEHALHDGLVIVNYVDEDPTAGLLDYDGGTWTYDTHRGTDISLHDFRAMDRGYRIRAAAPGTVSYAVYYNLRDRNCASPDNPTLNYLEVANGDGTYTYYYHLRANSMTVKLFENVQRGEVLGMAGSSGYSSGAHLHFEPADWLSGSYLRRDPWAGPDNPNPGLWWDQAPYAGAQHILVNDIGITTQTAVGGNLANVDWCTYFAERVSQPVVFGINEPFIPVWLGLQGLTGDSYSVEVRRPNASLYSSVNYTLPGQMQFGDHYWYWSWAGYVTSADYGTWTAAVKVGGQVVQQTSFVVGPTTIFGPRFVPRDGRSFRINGTVQRDTVHHSPLGGPVTYSLLNALPFVTLTDSILSIGAASTQPTRSFYFLVLATDAAARRDTAWYHIVDSTKTQEPVTDVAPHAATARLELAAAFPNPSHGSSALHFELSRRGQVTLAIYDLAGRRVRTLLDQERDPAPGGETVVWDGRDDAGRRVPSGVYFARLASAGELHVRRLVRLE